MIDVNKLQKGDVLRSNYSGNSYVVIHSDGMSVAVHALTVTNNHEWDIVAKTPVEKPTHRSVVRPWLTECCTMKQQTILLLAMRGCDGAPKNDRSKKYVRALRHALLFSADGAPKPNSFMHDGGAWTNFQVSHFVDSLDHYPLHWLTHFMHACAIVGYKHPDTIIAARWRGLYSAIATALHLNVETAEDVDRRLADVDPEPADKVHNEPMHAPTDMPRPKHKKLTRNLHDDDDEEE